MARAVRPPRIFRFVWPLDGRAGRGARQAAAHKQSLEGTSMAAGWKDDAELFALARRELFTALVGDAMDKLGLLHQFLPPDLKPLRDDMVVIGRAMTVLEADVVAAGPQLPPMRNLRCFTCRRCFSKM